MPKVSVIVPVYNTERDLPECLESLVSQTLEDIEIICVDNGSTDGSTDILRAYAERDGRVVVMTYTETQGPSGPRNAGLDASSGEFIQFFDADDFAEPTLLEEVYDRCTQDDAEMCVVKYRYVHMDTGASDDADCSLQMRLVPEKRPFSRVDLSGSVFKLSTPCVWNKTFRRSFIKRMGLRFSTELLGTEDVPFTYLALMTARRITVVDKVLVNYRTGIADSLQATIHERPSGICRALVTAKRAAIDAGVFHEVEQDFVNAALDQCLYTLKTVKTVEAFRVLFDELKQTYFAELGIDGRPKGYFPDDHYERYEMIRSMPVDAYLFGEDRSLRRELARRLDEIRTLRGRVLGSADEIKSLAGRLAASAEEVASLRSERDELARALVKTETRLDKAHGRLDDHARKLKELKAYRAYRAGLRVVRVQKRLGRMLSTRGKAE